MGDLDGLLGLGIEVLVQAQSAVIVTVIVHEKLVDSALKFRQLQVGVLVRIRVGEGDAQLVAIEESAARALVRQPLRTWQNDKRDICGPVAVGIKERKEKHFLLASLELGRVGANLLGMLLHVAANPDAHEHAHAKLPPHKNVSGRTSPSPTVHFLQELLPQGPRAAPGAQRVAPWPCRGGADGGEPTM